jgi:hypothetical protein
MSRGGSLKCDWLMRIFGIRSLMVAIEITVKAICIMLSSCMIGGTGILLKLFCLRID